MRLTWLNDLICKELYAPFKIDKDIDYRNDLEQKYSKVMEQAKNANADDESLEIIDAFSSKILKSLDLYYKADIAESNNIILELVKDIGETGMKFQNWWDRMSSQYQWESTENGNWEIDFDTNEIYLIYE